MLKEEENNKNLIKNIKEKNLNYLNLLKKSNNKILFLIKYNNKLNSININLLNKNKKLILKNNYLIDTNKELKNSLNYYLKNTIKNKKLNELIINNNKLKKILYQLQDLFHIKSFDNLESYKDLYYINYKNSIENKNLIKILTFYSQQLEFFHQFFNITTNNSININNLYQNFEKSASFNNILDKDLDIIMKDINLFQKYLDESNENILENEEQKLNSLDIEQGNADEELLNFDKKFLSNNEENFKFLDNENDLLSISTYEPPEDLLMEEEIDINNQDFTSSTSSSFVKSDKYQDILHQIKQYVASLSSSSSSTSSASSSSTNNISSETSLITSSTLYLENQIANLKSEISSLMNKVHELNEYKKVNDEKLSQKISSYNEIKHLHDKLNLEFKELESSNKNLLLKNKLYEEEINKLRDEILEIQSKNNEYEYIYEDYEEFDENDEKFNEFNINKKRKLSNDDIEYISTPPSSSSFTSSSSSSKSTPPTLFYDKKKRKFYSKKLKQDPKEIFYQKLISNNNNIIVSNNNKIKNLSDLNKSLLKKIYLLTIKNNFLNEVINNKLKYFDNNLLTSVSSIPSTGDNSNSNQLSLSSSSIYKRFSSTSNNNLIPKKNYYRINNMKILNKKLTNSTLKLNNLMLENKKLNEKINNLNSIINNEKTKKNYLLIVNRLNKKNYSKLLKKYHEVSLYSSYEELNEILNKRYENKFNSINKNNEELIKENQILSDNIKNLKEILLNNENIINNYSNLNSNLKSSLININKLFFNLKNDYYSLKNSISFTISLSMEDSFNLFLNNFSIKLLNFKVINNDDIKLLQNSQNLNENVKNKLNFFYSLHSKYLILNNKYNTLEDKMKHADVKLSENQNEIDQLNQNLMQSKSFNNLLINQLESYTKEISELKKKPYNYTQLNLLDNSLSQFTRDIRVKIEQENKLAGQSENSISSSLSSNDQSVETNQLIDEINELKSTNSNLREIIFYIKKEKEELEKNINKLSSINLLNEVKINSLTSSLSASEKLLENELKKKQKTNVLVQMMKKSEDDDNNDQEYLTNLKLNEINNLNKSQINNLILKNNELNESNQKYLANYDIIKKKLLLVNNNNAILTKEKNNLISMNNKLNQNLSNLLSTINNNNKKHDTILQQKQAEFNQLEENYKSTIEKLTSDINRLENIEQNSNKLRNKLREVLASNESLKNQSESFKHQIEQLNQQISSNLNTNTNLTNENENLKQQIGKLNADYEVIKENVEQYKSLSSLKVQENSTLTNEIKDLKEKLNKCLSDQENVKQLHQKIDELQKQNENQKKIIEKNSALLAAANNIAPPLPPLSSIPSSQQPPLPSAPSSTPSVTSSSPLPPSTDTVPTPLSVKRIKPIPTPVVKTATQPSEQIEVPDRQPTPTKKVFRQAKGVAPKTPSTNDSTMALKTNLKEKIKSKKATEEKLTKMQEDSTSTSSPIDPPAATESSQPSVPSVPTSSNLNPFASSFEPFSSSNFGNKTSRSNSFLDSNNEKNLTSSTPGVPPRPFGGFGMLANLSKPAEDSDASKNNNSSGSNPFAKK